MPVINLSNQELSQLLQSEVDLQVLDVRTPPEYMVLGHLPQAKLVPIQVLPLQLSTLNPELKTVVICEHGVRSMDASHYLLQNGFKQVYNLALGMAEWNGEREFASPEAGIPNQSC